MKENSNLTVWLVIIGGLVLVAGLAFGLSWKSHQDVYNPKQYNLSDAYVKDQYDTLLEADKTLSAGFQFEAAMSRATALSRLGKTAAAIRAWQYFVQNRPNAIPGYWGLAEIYTTQGKYDLAEANWLKAIEMDPKATYENSYTKLADLYKTSLPGKRYKIVQLLTQAMMQNPTASNYPLTLATYYYDIGDWASALRFYQQTVKVDPTSVKQLQSVITELEAKV